MVGILCDPSPGMQGRMALVRSAAFEPLWTHGQLAAQGRLPPDVAAAAAAAEAEGGAEAAAKVGKGLGAGRADGEGAGG